MWLLVGLILGAIIFGLVNLMRNKNFSLTWYEWLIGAIGLLLLLFTFQNFFGSFIENQPDAAWMFLLVTGLPGLVLLIVTWQLAVRRYGAS